MTTLNGQAKTEMMFARYRDRGVIYTVVVEQYTYTQNTTGQTVSPTSGPHPPPEMRRIAHYVPVVIYGCGVDTFYCVYMTAGNVKQLVYLIILICKISFFFSKSAPMSNIF